MPVALDQSYNIVGNVRAAKHSTSLIIDEGVNQCIDLWNPATPSAPGYYTLFTGNGATASSCQGNIAWQQVAPYAPHTTQANTDLFREPGANQIDSNLSKNFKLGDRLTMQLRLEDFNVLSHPIWYWETDMTPTDVGFGTVNKTWYGQMNYPRFGQLGAKVTW